MGFLSCRSGAPEVAAEVLEVFPANVELQHLFDHRREVGQRADGTQRSRAGGPHDSPRRSEDERILYRFERHTALVQLVREQTVGTAHDSGGSRRRTISIEKPANIVAPIDLTMLHAFSPADRAARGR